MANAKWYNLLQIDQRNGQRVLKKLDNSKLSRYFTRVHRFPSYPINIVGDRHMPVLGDFNESAILIGGVTEAVNEMKSDMATGLGGFPVDSLKKGGMAVLEWVMRPWNENFDIEVMHTCGLAWCFYKVSLDKGKGDKYRCRYWRGMCLSSVVIKGAL